MKVCVASDLSDKHEWEFWLSAYLCCKGVRGRAIWRVVSSSHLHCLMQEKRRRKQHNKKGKGKIKKANLCFSPQNMIFIKGVKFLSGRTTKKATIKFHWEESKQTWTNSSELYIWYIFNIKFHWEESKQTWTMEHGEREKTKCAVNLKKRKRMLYHSERAKTNIIFAIMMFNRPCGSCFRVISSCFERGISSEEIVHWQFIKYVYYNCPYVLSKR